MAVYANELNSELQENENKLKKKKKKKEPFMLKYCPISTPQFSKRNASHQNAWTTITKHMRDIS